MFQKRKKRFFSGILIAAVLMSAIPVSVYAETGQKLSLEDQDAKSVSGWVGEIDRGSDFDFYGVVPSSDWYQNNNAEFVLCSSPTDSVDGVTDVIEYNPYYKTKDNSKGKIYKDYPLDVPGYYSLSAFCDISLQSPNDIGKLKIEAYDNTTGTGEPVNSSSSASAIFKSGEWDTVSIKNFHMTSRVKMIRIVLEASADPIDENNYIDFDGLSVLLTQVAAPPIISHLDGDTVTFTEGSFAVPLDKDSNVTAKVDTDFGRTYAGGSITASITNNGVAAEDVLELAQTGGITLSGGTVFYSGTSIGAYSGGTSGTALTILLNSNANDTSAAALIKAITYKNTNTLKPNTNPRTVMISASDSTNASEPVHTTVHVQSVNYAPVRKSGVGESVSASLPVKTSYSLDLSTIFEDPDIDPLSYKIKVNNGNEQTTTRNYTFTPATAGTYTIVFTANDGSVDSIDTYTVTLTAVNTAPVRKSGVEASTSINMTVNTEYSMDLSTIFQDADDDPLTYKVSVNDEPECSVGKNTAFTPDVVGTYKMVYKANDGTVDSVDTYTVTLNVKAANTPPVRKSGVNETVTDSVAVKKAYPIILNTIFEDADHDTLTYKVAINGGAEVIADESYSYTPTAVGTDTLVFRANDGNIDSTDTFTVTLMAVNTLPARKSGVGESVSGNVTSNTIYSVDLSQIFEDENKDPLTYKVKVNGGTEETVGKDYSFTPTAAGTYTLVFKANDGHSDSADIYTVTLNAKEPNRAPVRKNGVIDMDTIIAPVNLQLSISLEPFFEDADGDPLTYKVKIDDQPEVEVNKLFHYLVSTVGTHTLIFKANDGFADSTETYTLYVTATKVPVRSIAAPGPVTGITNGSAKTASSLGLPANVNINTDMGPKTAVVSWNVGASSYDPDEKAEQTFEVEGTVNLPEEVYNPDGISLNVTINVTVKAEELVNKVLERISPLSPVTGILNGSVKTAPALGLPANVSLQTDHGIVSAHVTWDVAGSSYDPGQKTEQTFEIKGTVSIPSGVINPNGISLDITVEVTVDAESLTDKTLEKISPLSPVKMIANGTAKTVTALGIPARVKLGTNAGNVYADLIWDLDSSSYDPNIRDEQTFTVEGTVILPDHVINPFGIPLEIRIEVTVLEEQEEQEYYTLRIRVTKRPDKVSYMLGEDLDTQGLEVTEYQKASPSNAVRKTVLSEGQYDLEYDLARTGTCNVKVIYYGTGRDGNEKEFTDEFPVMIKELPRDDRNDDDDREITKPVRKRQGGDDDHYYSGSWHSDENGWRFSGKDGSSPANRWVYTDWKGSKDWYFFDEKGYMVTGWYEYKGNMYYLNPVSDGKKGYMFTGWNVIEGKWYYFSETADETKGSMLKDTITPDGYRVGPDGARVS